MVGNFFALRSALVALGVMSALFAAPATRAAIITYDFTFVDGTVVGTYSGQLQVDDTTNLIVGISGSGDIIGTITALIQPRPFFNDNLFFATEPHLTSIGVEFFTTGANGQIGILYEASSNTYFTETLGFRGSSTFTPGSFAVTASTDVPEPASLTLFGAGLLGLAAAGRGRQRGSTAAAQGMSDTERASR